MTKIEQAIRCIGIKFEYADTGISNAEIFKTLIHEYAHELLHQTRKLKDSKTIRELEADAVACVVSEHFGICTMQASADYIRMWDGDKKILLERMERIRDCSNTILKSIKNASISGNM